MPTFVHGKDTRHLANGYDVSGYFKTVGSKRTADHADTSAIGSASKSYLPGLKDGTFSADGFADGTAGGINAQLDAILGTQTVWTSIPAVDAIGALGRAAITIENDLEVSADVGSAVSIKATGQATGGMDAVVVLHPLQVEAAGGSGASVNNGAASSNGLDAYLHTTAVGTTGTVTVQHSTDNASWVDLLVMTPTTTAHHGENKNVAGTVNQYLRALWTETGTTLTFHLAAARL